MPAWRFVMRLMTVILVCMMELLAGKAALSRLPSSIAPREPELLPMEYLLA